MYRECCMLMLMASLRELIYNERNLHPRQLEELKFTRMHFTSECVGHECVSIQA